MHKCPECGYDMAEEKSEGSFSLDDGDKEASAKGEILDELMEMLDGGLSDKLKSKKPSITSVEVIEAKPKKSLFTRPDDEDEEEFA